MNKFVVPVLAVALIMSVTGCISKSEHEKVLNEKALIEQNYARAVQENTRLENQVLELQRAQIDLERLAQENSRLKKEQDSLIQQLTERAATIKALNDELSKLKAANEAVPQQ